jgi:hypothetical protein
MEVKPPATATAKHRGRREIAEGSEKTQTHSLAALRPRHAVGAWACWDAFGDF